MSDSKIEAAIAKIKEKATDSVKQIMKNAEAKGLVNVVEACAEELKLRGSLELDKHGAEKMIAAHAKVEGKSLTESIGIAFTDVPPTPDEIRILKWISKNPETSYAATLKAYGRNDLSLVIGHLVYERLGYFRSFFETDTMSDVLLSRSKSGGGVCYTLRAESLQALSELNVI